MSREKRRYTRMAPSPISWNIQKAKSLWLKKTPVKEMAVILGITELAVKMASRRYGWPKRKEWQKKPVSEPAIVLRRCEDCGGTYKGSVTQYLHPECRFLPRIGTVEAPKRPEGSPMGVAA